MKTRPRTLFCFLLGWAGGLAVSLLGLARRMTGGVAGSALFVASVLYLYLFRRYGINVMDEGIPLNCAQRIVDGEILYRDFYAPYGPARHYLLAAVFGVLGPRLLFARLLWHLFVAACGVMVFRIGRRLMPPGVALAAGAFFVFVPVQHYKIFFVATYLVIILATLRAVESDTKRAWLVAGLWGGVCALFRLEMGVVAFCLMGAVLVFTSGRPGGEWLRWVAARLACVAGGLAAIVGPVLLYFIWADCLPMLVRFTRLQYDQHRRFFTQSAPSIAKGWDAMWSGGLNTPGAWKLFDTLAMYMPGLLCAGALLLVLVRSVKGRRRPGDPALLAIGVAGIPMQKFFLARPDFDHLLHIIVTAYLLAFALAARSFLAARKGRSNPAVFWRHGLVFALCVLFLGGFAFTAVFRRDADNVPVHAEMGGSIGKAVKGNQEEVLLPRAGYLDWMERKEITMEIARLVRWAQTEEEVPVPADGFAFFKFGSFWYFALKLENPTNQEPLYSYGDEAKIDGMNEEERVVQSLKKHKVRYIFLHPDQPGEKTFREVNSKIWEFLEREFKMVPPPGARNKELYFRSQYGWTVWRRK